MSGYLCFLFILICGQSLSNASIIKYDKTIPSPYTALFYSANDLIPETSNKFTPRLAVYDNEENLIPEKDDRRISKFTQALDKFHHRLTKTVLSHYPGENVIYSPISISILLMMIAFGSRGATLQEIFQQTGMEFDTQTLLGFQEIINVMKNVHGIELELANVVFASHNIDLISDYRNSIKTFLNSDIRSIDFTNTQVAAQQINNWCRVQTRNQITEIITPNGLEDMVLILANAIYFKGNWLKPFKVADTQLNVPFYVSKNTTVPVSMMFISDEFNYGRISELNAFFIELPYTHEQYKKDFFSMYILVPIQNDGLGLIEKNLHLIDFRRLNFFEDSVYVHLPKFKIESTLNLRPIFEKMGMSNMFSENADFRGLFNDQHISLGKIVQKASLKVNEKGTVAAAVSAGGFADRIGPSQFLINKSFMCAIVLKSVGLPVFYARVVDPTKSG